MTANGRLRRYAEDLRSLPHDAALAWREGGLTSVWEAVADRSLHRVVNWGRLVVIAQPLDRFREAGPPAGVTIRRTAGADWAALAAIVPRRDFPRFARQAEAGRVCVAAWRGASPIGYTWLAEQLGPDVTALPLPLPETAAYLYDLYVLRAERSNGIGSALVSARLAIARELGFAEGWRMIAPTNRASFRTMEKTSGAGTRVVGELRFVKLGPRMRGRFLPL